MDTPAMAPIVRAFQARHPGVRVDYDERNSIDLHTRFLDAASANTATADLVMSSAIDLQMKLVNDGHARAHRTPHAAALPVWAIWRDEAFAFSFEPVVTVINADRIEARNVPDSRYRLLELLREDSERFRGRIGTYDPSRSGTGYLYLTQDMEQSPIVWELIRALGQARVRLFGTSREVIDAVSSGELLIGYNVVGSYAFSRARSDPTLKVITPRDYTLVVARTAFVSRHGLHPGLARQFLDYLLSREGQRVVAGPSGLFPIRDGVVDGTTADIRAGQLPGARAVRMGPGLLVYVDRLKREKVLRRWRDAIEAGPPLF
jgi:ABC-type Fe3+ transport system substrate-binding protein